MEPTAPPPPAAVLQLILNVWATQAAASFARFGMADILARGPLSSDDIAARAHTNRDATYRLLRALAGIGVVQALPDHRFSLTPVGECLRADVPGSMRSLLIAEMAPGHWLPWGEIDHAVRTGTPATIPTLGKAAWQYYGEHPQEAEHFARGMSGISGMATQAVLESYSFAGAALVVDVGGSHGALLTAVLHAVPGARGILFDQPNVIPGAAPALAAAGVADRVTTVGGNFFERVPEGGDVYLLKHILHDWNDDECVQILATCGKAMDPRGRVVVVELLIDDQGPPSPAPLMDLNMMVMLTGRERSEAEFGALFSKAGLRLTKVVRTHSPFVVVEGVRA
jgi:hypothetical protein